METQSKGPGAFSNTTESKQSKSEADFYSSIPKNDSVEVLQHFFGERELEPFDNSEILRCRLLYQVKSSSIENCTDIREIKTKKLIGTVPILQLRHAWRMAHSKYAEAAVKNKLFFMTEAEWESDLEKLECYIIRKRGLSQDCTILFSDVWELSELEYESVGLTRPTQFMALLQTAILGEIEENRKLAASWEKIKRYLHIIPLEKSKGGIFSVADATRLKDCLHVKCLNQLRRIHILKLKNAMLDYDFATIVADINRAYREDRAKRIDRRFKIDPFFYALINLGIVLFFGYSYQYTLIKNAQMTNVIMVCLTLFVIDALFVVIGGLRGKRRRRKRPSYVYYTKKVKRAIVIFSLFALFSIASIFVFYQRYDGYNSIVFYRDLKDGTVTVAGLFDKNVSTVHIADTIDGKTVSEIDAWAFKGEDIESVTLPDTLTKIDKAAFKNCSLLQEISIPEGVTSIAKDAFKGCDDLTGTLALPSTLESIGKNAFKGSDIEALAFSEHASVSIGKSAFEGCSRLKSITNPSAITSIGDKAFKGCSNLQSIAFTNKLTSIGKEAFKGCKSMTSIIVPESVSSIGKKAFYGCEQLKSITLPFPGMSLKSSSKKSISTILNPSEPISLTICSANPIYAKSLKKVSFISSISLDDRITEIEKGTFQKMESLKTIKLPSSISEIPSAFFENCSALQTVIGFDSVRSIGASAFQGCTALSSIDLQSVQTIEASAFEGCSSLASINLTSTTSVGSAAFKNCIHLGSVFGTAALKSIGDSAFSGCLELTTVGDFTSLEVLGKSAFDGCYVLGPTLRFTEKLTSLGSFAFQNCRALSQIDLENAPLRSIGIYVFDGCQKLSSITLPKTLEAIAQGTFSNCNSMQSLSSISNLSELTALVTIEERAFEGSGLSGELIIPSTVSTIGERAFSRSLITAISLPTSLQTIGKGAFANCTELRTATLPFLGNARETKQDGYTWVFENSVVPTVTLLDITRVTKKTFAGGETVLTTVILPDDVTKLEENAFKGFTALRTVELPAELTAIGKNAFRDCNNLIDIILPSKLRTIDDNAFRGCSKLTTVVFPEGFDSLGVGAYQDCINLTTIGDAYTNVSFPSSLRVIPQAAFKNCQNLRNVNLTDSSLTHIGAYAFAGTKVAALGSLTFGDTLLAIEEFAFSECGQIIEVVVLSEHLSDIDVQAFGESPSLRLFVPNETMLETFSKLFERYPNVEIELILE